MFLDESLARKGVTVTEADDLAVKVILVALVGAFTVQHALFPSIVTVNFRGPKKGRPAEAEQPPMKRITA